MSVWTLAQLLDITLKVVSAKNATRGVTNVAADYRTNAAHASLNIFSIRINVLISACPQNIGNKEIV